MKKSEQVTFILNFPGGCNVSERRVPEFKITQSTSVTLCMISVIKFPVTHKGKLSLKFKTKI